MKLKIILKYFFKFIPWRLRQIIKLMLLIQREKSYPISDFPLIGEKRPFKFRDSYLNRILDFDNDNYQYHSKIYNDPRQFDTDVAESDVFKTSIEILPGSFSKKHKFEIHEKSIFHISKPNFSHLRFRVSKKKEENLFNLTCLRNRFISFFEESDSIVEIESKEKFFASEPIGVHQKIKNKRKLVLFIFIDGLADRSVLGINSLQDYMPKTAKFFDNCFDFRNHHVNAEWTLPSFASIFTGQYSHNHNLYNPHKIEEVGMSSDILSQYYKRKNYLTFSTGGNPRISPPQGYVKGFDRTIYRFFMPAQELIANFLEHNIVFKNRDQFCFLQFSDVHHNLPLVPDYSVMSSLSSLELASELDPSLEATRNRWIPASENKKNVYRERVRRLDNYLNIIYKHVNDNYDPADVTVCLTSDHGQSYLSEDNHWLSEARTKAMWLLKSGDRRGCSILDYTEGVDVFNTVLNDSGIKVVDDVDGLLPVAFGGKKKRDFSFAHSIYPGQTYKAVINAEHGRYIYETLQPIKNSNDICEKKFFVTSNKKSKFSFSDEEVRNLVVDLINRKLL